MAKAREKTKKTKNIKDTKNAKNAKNTKDAKNAKNKIKKNARKADKKSKLKNAAEKTVNLGAKRSAVFQVLSDAARNYRTALGTALGDLGIYPGQEQLLLTLHNSGALAPSVLADRLGVKAPTVTKMVSRLAANGLVEKSRQEADRRMVVIALTPSGQDVITNLEKRKQKVEKVLFAGLSEAECDALGALLGKILPVENPEAGSQ